MENKIIDAVNWATKILADPPSKKTQIQYTKMVDRLLPRFKKGLLPGSAKNRNTRSFERAAFRFEAATKILEHANGKPENVIQIFKIVKKVEAIAIQNQKDYKQGKDPKTGEKIPNGQVKKTKRTSLRHLGPDWREKLIAASIGSMYEKEIRVMAICGCRPDEMEKGVTVKRLTNTIEITIKGSKCSEKTNTGQAWRTLTFDANHPLIEDVTTGNYQAKAHSIGDAVSHFGKKISNNKKHPISAYSFRHAAASNFKASGLSVEEIAAALGHRSTVTMSFYGSKSSGSGIVVLQKVNATSPVQTPKTKSKPKL
jgi:hypothetical protein